MAARQMPPSPRDNVASKVPANRAVFDLFFDWDIQIPNPVLITATAVRGHREQHVSVDFHRPSVGILPQAVLVPW